MTPLQHKNGCRQCVHEQLGAPCLLYRARKTDYSPPRPWNYDGERYESRYLHTTLQTFNRVRARWYHGVDHSYRQDARSQEVPSQRKVNAKKKSVDEPNDKRADETRSDATEQSYARSAGISKAQQIKQTIHNPAGEAKEGHDDDDNWSLDSSDKAEDHNEDEPELSKRISSTDTEDDNEPKKPDNPLFDPSFLKSRVNSLSEDARKQLLGDDEASFVLRQSYRQYDHSYIPGHSRKTRDQYALRPERIRLASSMQVDRMNADPAYLAPVGFTSLDYCLNDGEDDLASKEEKKLSQSKRRRVTFPIEAHDAGSPLKYGNCLICLPCPCCVCKDDDPSSSHRTRHAWCLIHPTGELLSQVCISSLLLPHGMQNAAPKKGEFFQVPKRHELDVGETILQISPCGSGNESNSTFGLFMVRSANYCTIVRIQTYVENNKQYKIESHKNACLGLYRLDEVTRIDLRSLCPSMFPSFTPLDASSHPQYGNQFSAPKFAILSQNATTIESNTIHHVLLREMVPEIQKHSIPCLKAISRVDFTSNHPMVLWAAAESYVRPKLLTDMYCKKPLLGHGHSLYTVDLRSNNAIFQWSPSAEKMVVEGVHSISGIMTEWQKEHTVWVTSSSAGKTWEIDSRMPCRAVNSFSLASICDDDRSLLPAMGLFGAGSILTQPFVSFDDKRTDFTYPVLSVDKSPGVYGFHVYQRPAFRPRFQTDSLECVACPGLIAWSTQREVSVARSSRFALPDVSESVFTCGLASFRTSASDFISSGAIESLGYCTDTDSVLCAITMTNRGDLYSYTLLECSDEDKCRSRLFPGLPLGSTVIAVPKPAIDTTPEEQVPAKRSGPEAKAHGGWNLRLSLSNDFPRTSSEITSMSVMSRNECQPFTTVRLEQIPTHPASHCNAAENDTSLANMQLPKEFTNVTRNEIGKFREDLLRPLKSVVEQGGAGGEDRRSDMTAQVLKAAADLWTGDDEFTNHANISAVKEEHDTSS